MVKQLTSPPLVIRLIDGEEALAAAQTVTVNLANRNYQYSIPAETIGDSQIMIWLTAEETRNLQGNCSIEVTFTYPDNMVLKSRTKQINIHKSVEQRGEK